MARETVFVDTFTDGILRPDASMLGPVRDGGYIVANTAPGCWGPMITPAIRGGHEVTQPVAVEGAEVGDAVALRIEEIVVTSSATSSGTDSPVDGRYRGDPYVAACCQQCGAVYPPTKLEGVGREAVRCEACGAEASPFELIHGYTVAIDAGRAVGVGLGPAQAKAVARDARRYAALPANSIQNPILVFGVGDLPGLVVRLRPFLGQIGTIPGVAMPDSHNAGDFGSFLVGAPHEYALSGEQLALRTDGHMDIDAARAGAVVICPVKVPGAGIYVGDMHACQGDGEVAGHTADVSGIVTLRVRVIKKLEIDGPVILPVSEDLPPLARPLTASELAAAREVARLWGMGDIEESLPVSFVGTGTDLNAATQNGLERAARVLDMTVHEVRNRATVAGAIEIGRLPGVVQVTFRAPTERLEKAGLLPVVREQYGQE